MHQKVEKGRSILFTTWCVCPLFSPPQSTHWACIILALSYIIGPHSFNYYCNPNLMHYSCSSLHSSHYSCKLLSPLSVMDGTNPYSSSNQNCSKSVSSENRESTPHCRFKLPKGSKLSMRFLKQLAAQVVRTLHSMSIRRRHSSKDSSSKPFVAPVDSRRTEAIEDCIEFINSSSSFSRSNSVSAKHTWCCKHQ